MAEDSDKDSKTEDPTDKKITDALDKGNTAFSKEITTAASVLALLMATWFFVPHIVGELSQSLRLLLGNISDLPMHTPEDASSVIFMIVKEAGKAIAPLLLILMAFGFVAAISQNMPRFIGNRIQPKFSRISLAGGLKKLFGKQGMREFVKSIFKFSAAGLIAFLAFLSQQDLILNSMHVEAGQIPFGIRIIFMQILMGLLLMTVVLATVDFVWVKKDWFDDLKMTHQEVKDETKQSEGDPTLKAKARSLARDRARSRMMGEVQNASLVIANPTHFSVAMRYDPKVDAVPKILAKGQDLIALKIREIAEENDIPVYEDVPLARALYKIVQVEGDLPVEFYAPVAAVIKALGKKIPGMVQ
ncbi:MAG: flagellar biosynthesis protein FlhB [Rhizobiaceae bacterium]|nr:flagellar biosynthesis protein FlhB [Rhizobiaceae bacterium]